MFAVFGKCTTTTHTSSNALLNRLLYRGYYSDAETGFYYLNSRYYDPATCRFINADTSSTLLASPMSLTDKNLFAYCDNNPVIREDNGGMFWDTVFDFLSLASSVVDVIENPTDPMAWLGLAADIVSVAVPFATGGGAVVDAVTKSDDVVDLVKYGDDVVDFAKNADNVVDAIDSAYDSTKAIINIPDCFIAGTLVSTENGNMPIEAISVGDYVWATDPETRETELKQVVNTFVNETTAVFIQANLHF